MQNAEGCFILSDELLIKILKYVGKYRENAVKLVCKHFYYLICDLEKSDKQLQLSGEVLENEEDCNIIIDSPRKFTKIMLKSYYDEMSFEVFHRLLRICMAIGDNIKELEWNYCKMTILEHRLILSFLPNLEKLTCNDWKFSENIPAEQMTNMRLRKLKQLEINCDNEAPALVLKNIFLEQNTINQLAVSGTFNPKDIFQHQRNVKKLEIDLDVFEINDLDCFDLQELKLVNCSDLRVEHLEEIVTKQSNLTSLDILDIQDFFISQQAFIKICQLKLTDLRIDVQTVDAAIFKVHFWRLQSLNELHIGINEEEKKKNFLDMKFPKLKNLVFPESIKLSTTALSNMEKNLPALNRIQLEDGEICLGKALEKLSQLTTIQLFNSTVHWKYEQQYPKLKALKLDNSVIRNISDEGALYKMIRSFPNLEVLQVHFELFLYLNLLDNILTNLPHLHTLKCLTFNQEGKHYEEFNKESALKLLRFMKEIPSACVRVQLQESEMEVTKLEEMLQTHFIVEVYEDYRFKIIIRTENCEECEI